MCSELLNKYDIKKRLCSVQGLPGELQAVMS
jgi:hypothetical protein